MKRLFPFQKELGNKCSRCPLARSIFTQTTALMAFISSTTRPSPGRNFLERCVVMWQCPPSRQSLLPSPRALHTHLHRGCAGEGTVPAGTPICVLVGLPARWDGPARSFESSLLWDFVTLILKYFLLFHLGVCLTNERCIRYSEMVASLFISKKPLLFPA